MLGRHNFPEQRVEMRCKQGRLHKNKATWKQLKNIEIFKLISAVFADYIRSVRKVKKKNNDLFEGTFLNLNNIQERLFHYFYFS